MTTLSNEIIDQIIGNAKTEQDLFGTDGVLKTFTKQLMERMISTELDHHLGYEKHSIEGNNTGNSRNGKSKKRSKQEMVKLKYQLFEIEIVILNQN